MRDKFMTAVEATGLNPNAAKFEVGDTVDVHQKILEGQKERTQIFSGNVRRVYPRLTLREAVA